VAAQFIENWPDNSVSALDVLRQFRLTDAFEVLIEGYADRPALGVHTRDLAEHPPPAHGQLLLSFDTITYRAMCKRVRAIATGLRHDERHPVCRR
jgi:fatty acid CoA ligase FadD9